MKLKEFSKTKLTKREMAVLFMWRKFTKQRKCIFCNTKFPKGITNKYPNNIFPFKAIYMFTPEYLVHSKTTHGIGPDTLDLLLQKQLNNMCL